MKNKNHEILTELRNNARTSISSISKTTNIPYSTISDKIKDLEKNVITKYTSIVDFRKIGYLLKAVILLKVNENNNQLEQFLKVHNNINNISRIGNGYDYLIEVLFKDNDEYNSFIEELKDKNVTEIKSHFIIEDLSREQAFTNNENFPKGENTTL